jgi:hypothetical protein
MDYGIYLALYSAAGRTRTPAPACLPLSAHRLFFYEPQGFKHPHDGRSLFIDATPVALIFLQTWGGFFNLG